MIQKIIFKLSFLLDFRRFKKLSAEENRFPILWKDRNLQLYDKTPSTGFDRHYIYHPAWAVRVVKKINPPFHVDISSILTFCSTLSAFIPVHFYDIRPADLELSGLKSEKCDLLKLPFADASVKSISCMHTIEHIGLGRYGDPLDQNGDLKAIRELKRVLAPGGSLLFVTPIGGQPKIQYNAHRIYSYKQIMSYFSDLKLEEFSLIKNEGGAMIENATEEDANRETYGCGCFWFKK